MLGWTVLSLCIQLRFMKTTGSQDGYSHSNFLFPFASCIEQNIETIDQIE